MPFECVLCPQRSFQSWKSAAVREGRTRHETRARLKWARTLRGSCSRGKEDAQGSSVHNSREKEKGQESQRSTEKRCLPSTGIAIRKSKDPSLYTDLREPSNRCKKRGLTDLENEGRNQGHRSKGKMRRTRGQS